jgi:hypothetical protein
MSDAPKWFVAAAEATVELLDRCGEKPLARKIREALDGYARTANVEPFLGLFEGTGSLHDLILSEKSGHKITALQFPWVNTLLQALLGLASSAGQSIHAREKFSTDQSWFEWHRKIQGWYCSDCEYTSLNAVEIEAAIAAWTISEEFKPHAPADCRRAVETALKGDSATIARRREALRENARIANISLAEQDREKRPRALPCPKCGSDKTGVFRWILKEDDVTLAAAEAGSRKGGRGRRPDQP